MSEPREHGIPYSPEMMLARLAGLKTMTRRVIKPLPSGPPLFDPAIGWRFPGGPNMECPYGRPGDRLWPREHFRFPIEFDDRPPRDVPHDAPVRYECDGHETALRFIDRGRFRPGRFMPRWASRGLDEVVAVCAERVQDISEADAECEGVEPASPPEATGARCRPAFRHLWDSINAKRGYGWDANPWVWVVEFRRVEG